MPASRNGGREKVRITGNKEVPPWLQRRDFGRRLFPLLLLSRRGRRWGYGCVIGCQNFPTISLTDIDIQPIALHLHRRAVLCLKSHIPLPGGPYLIARSTYNMREILIRRTDMADEMYFLEPVCKEFLDGLPSMNRSCSWIHKTRVLHEECGCGSRIAFDHCIVKLLHKCKILLA